MSEDAAIIEAEAEPERVLPHTPTPELRSKVRTLAKVKTKMGQVAREIGITITEFKRHYEHEFELGREEAETGLLGKLLAQGMAGNTNAAFKYLTLMGLVPVQRHEHTGKDGRPIETVDLTRLSAEQLEAYGRLAAIAEGIDPDSILIEPVEPRTSQAGAGIPAVAESVAGRDAPPPARGDGRGGAGA